MEGRRGKEGTCGLLPSLLSANVVVLSTITTTVDRQPISGQGRIEALTSIDIFDSSGADFSRCSTKNLSGSIYCNFQ